MAPGWDAAGAGRADGRPRLRDTPEKRLERACRRVLALKGFEVWHLSQARATQQSAGLPDDFVTGGPRPIALEYKVLPNRQTPAQRAFQAAWERSGGIYILVFAVDELVAWLDHLQAP